MAQRMQTRSSTCFSLSYLPNLPTYVDVTTYVPITFYSVIYCLGITKITLTFKDYFIWRIGLFSKNYKLADHWATEWSRVLRNTWRGGVGTSRSYNISQTQCSRTIDTSALFVYIRLSVRVDCRRTVSVLSVSTIVLFLSFHRNIAFQLERN